MASVFWDVDNRHTLRNLMIEEKRQGLRDQVCFWTDREIETERKIDREIGHLK